jgi:triosephosphate isomerase
MRIPLIAGNWKMNTTLTEAINLVNEMLPRLEEVNNIDILLCPPFISLAAVKGLLEGSPVKLGAQDLYFAEKGAYTGEISPPMLKELCEFVIIGHSERRQYFNETGEIVNKKLQAALKTGLKPILCVGERLEENEAGRAEEVIDDIGSLLIAYEPVWAIGTGRAATGSQANETIGLIRRNMAKLYSETVARDLRILYGGSVTAGNTAEFMGQPKIDGALVGGASLKADEFIGIVKQTKEIKGRLSGG